MSLFHFPSLNTEGRPYVIQEYNGRIFTGTEDEFLAVNKCRLLADFPSIDRTQLSALRHCISKDNIKNVFANGDGGVIDSAWNQFEGFSGVVKRVTDATEPTRLWPLAKIGRGVLKVHNGMASIASKVITGKSLEKVDEVMEQYSATLNWKKNWIRCIAVHPSSLRLAICQPDDYIRIFNIGSGESRTPITLKHEKQENVTCMAWEPHDHRVLAVAANGYIIIWKLAAKSMNIRPSGQCVKVISTTVNSITSIIWDRMSSRGLFVTSPECAKIMAVDTVNEEIELLGGSWSWGSGSPVKLISSTAGNRIAVFHTSNVLRIYNRLTWDSEKFSTKGRVLDAVWTPGAELIFASENSTHLYVIAFSQVIEKSWEGKEETKWVGSSPQSIFDLTPVEFDSAEAELQGGVERPLIEIGGHVQSLALSPDGKRLAVNFKKFSEVVAIFIVEWNPVLKLTPCTLVEAPNFGSASLLTFLPKFNEGSLLSIVWSDGYAQYLPFIYSFNSSMVVPITNILDEISADSNILGNGNSKRWSISDSLRSDDFPSGICDRSDEINDELMSERIKRPRQN